MVVVHHASVITALKSTISYRLEPELTFPVIWVPVFAKDKIWLIILLGLDATSTEIVPSRMPLSVHIPLSYRTFRLGAVVDQGTQCLPAEQGELPKLREGISTYS